MELEHREQKVKELLESQMLVNYPSDSSYMGKLESEDEESFMILKHLDDQYHIETIEGDNTVIVDLTMSEVF